MFWRQLFCPLPVCLKKLWGLPQRPEKVFVGVQPGFLCGFHQAVNHSAGPGSRRGVGKQPVLPAHHKGLYAALGTVVGYLQPAVLQVADKISFLGGCSLLSTALLELTLTLLPPPQLLRRPLPCFGGCKRPGLLPAFFTLLFVFIPPDSGRTASRYLPPVPWWWCRQAPRCRRRGR